MLRICESRIWQLAEIDMFLVHRIYHAYATPIQEEVIVGNVAVEVAYATHMRSCEASTGGRICDAYAKHRICDAYASLAGCRARPPVGELAGLPNFSQTRIYLAYAR